MFAAALEVRLPDPRELAHQVATRTVTIDEKSDLILKALEEVTSIEFRRLIRPFRDRVHGVMTFLAGLELTRSRLVRLRQSRPFHELWLHRWEGEGDEPDAPESDG